MFWYFYLDGTIQLEIQLTGVLSTSVTDLLCFHVLLFSGEQRMCRVLVTVNLPMSPALLAPFLTSIYCCCCCCCSTPQEYGMFWYFYLDGTIQLEMKLTGILSTSVTDLTNKDLPFGITVAPGVVASNHQHLFCMRIDPAVDDEQGGKGLVVAEVNAEPLPFGPDNPHGEWLLMVW
jgi:Cu2+-containing amine oxidase